jgi:hypothetical protein
LPTTVPAIWNILWFVVYYPLFIIDPQTFTGIYIWNWKFYSIEVTEEKKVRNLIAHAVTDSCFIHLGTVTDSCFIHLGTV